MIVKVKEPQPGEWAQLREGQILYTYLHLAPDPDADQGPAGLGRHGGRLRDRDRRARRPAAARADVGSRRPPGHPGRRDRAAEGQWRPRRAARRRAGRAAGQGRRHRRRRRRPAMRPRWRSASAPTSPSSTARSRACASSTTSSTAASTPAISTVEALEDECFSADVVIGAVLIPGAAAPKLVTREMLSGMKKGAVLVDVAIDQGGCFETSHATTHADPTYEVDGVIHYCVANMPGAVPVTSAHALNNATLHYGLALADKGLEGSSPTTRICATASTSTSGKVTNRRSPKRSGYEMACAGSGAEGRLSTLSGLNHKGPAGFVRPAFFVPGLVRLRSILSWSAIVARRARTCDVSHIGHWPAEAIARARIFRRGHDSAGTIDDAVIPIIWQRTDVIAFRDSRSRAGCSIIPRDAGAVFRAEEDRPDFRIGLQSVGMAARQAPDRAFRRATWRRNAGIGTPSPFDDCRSGVLDHRHRRAGTRTARRHRRCVVLKSSWSDTMANLLCQDDCGGGYRRHPIPVNRAWRCSEFPRR